MAKILIVAPNWIGDALLAQPLFARLRQKDPSVLIDALAPPWTAPVLRRMPEIAEVIDAPFGHGELKLAECWRLGRSLHVRAYDQAIVLPNTLKSALIPLFAGIPLRTGFTGELRYGLLNRVHKLDERALPLMVERYAQLAEEPGIPPARPLAVVGLRVDEANLAAALARLELSRSKPVVAFCPGAEYGPAKRWPARHFAERRQARRAGACIWLFAWQGCGIGEDIVRLRRASRSTCGKTDLGAPSICSPPPKSWEQRPGLMRRRGGRPPRGRVMVLQPRAHSTSGSSFVS